MRVSVNWLREYIDFDCSVEELAQRLTMAGLEVEESHELSSDDFVAAGGSGSVCDTVWDIKVLANRGDWLSMIGVAREVASLVGGTARVPQPVVAEVDPPASDLVKISIDADDLCRRYAGVIIKGVAIKESPGWLKDRIIAAGMRPINNVVDITNYVMFELGQPLHAFDYSLLKGREIIVRRARAGETITSIDGTERRLDPDMLVIADAERPVAIAGVMGGADSEISEQTQEILVESANFNCTSVRRTSKRLGMVTESSYRFERSVDPSICALAAWRAAELIAELGGGSVARGIVDVYPSPVEPARIDLRPRRVNDVMGLDIDAQTMLACLRSLEIEAEPNDGLISCVVPTARQDLTREIDLVEEVGRVYGYDKMPATLPARSLQGKDSLEGAFTERLRRILMGCGCQEVLTHSLVDSSLNELVGRPDSVLKLRNTLSEDLDSMRIALAPNLLQVIARNQAFGTSDLSIFEIGKTYGQDDGAIWECRSIAGAMIGRSWHNAWGLPDNAVEADFYWCKGAVESLLGGLGITNAEFSECSTRILHPTRAAKVLVNGKIIGVLGEASPEAIEFFDIKGRPCIFELVFDHLMDVTPALPKYQPLPRYPALYRHLAVVVPESVSYDAIRGVVFEEDAGLVEGVDLLDVYKGSQIAEDSRSLTISVVFRSASRTLTDDEVNTVLTNIREALRLRFNAAFR